MKSFHDLKYSVLALFDNTSKMAHQAGYEAIAKNVLAIKENFQRKELMVVVCGEMKRGKSSLLTAFLEEEKIFPVDINTCTNVITIVRYGKTEKVEVILEKQDKNGEAGYEKIPIKRDEIEQYVTEYGNGQNNKRVNCLNVEIPNKKLEDGFVFVDTPGVGSLNFEHAQVTYGFLPHADVMLFVSDVLNPLTEAELKFLEKSYGFCRNVVFPLTKSDKKNTEEINSTIESNRQKIKNTLHLNGENIPVIPVSNRMKLRYLENQKAEYLTNSNYPFLEGLIWKTIYDNRSRILVLPFLKQLVEEIQKMKSNIHVQLDALAKDKESVVQQTEEMQSKSSKKQALLTGNAKWKGDLQYELTNVSIEQTELLQNESINLTERMNTLLLQDGATERLESIIEQLNEHLVNLVYLTKEGISSAVEDIVSDVYNDLGLSLDVQEESMDSVGFKQQQSIEYAKTQKKVGDDLIIKGRQIGMSSMSGMTLGGLGGAIIGGVFGFLVGGPAGALALGSAAAQWGAGAGALAGTVKGGVDAVRNSNKEDIPAIRMALTNYINKSTRSINSGINLCIRELTKSLTEELTCQISEQVINLDTVIAQIKQNLALKQTDIPKQTSKLNMQLSMVEGLEKTAELLTQEISN